MSKYFGTDGIRGRAGDELTPELVLRASFGLARQLGTQRARYRMTKRPEIVVGRDPRLSSPMVSALVFGGLTFGGCDALDLGVVPTPVVPFVVQRRFAAGGVMITASHNPVADNGVKFFGPDGVKIDEKQERAIEAIIERPGRLEVAERLHFGILSAFAPANEYLAFVQRQTRRSRRGKSLSVVLDCAYGATSELAPEAFQRAGFEVAVVNAEFDGRRLNVRCGATDLRGIAAHVRSHGADLGLAFDGDGDRVLAVDHTGEVVSGDRIISLFATGLRRYRRQGAVVMTHMTNIGVVQALRRRGIAVRRTDVGDMNVLARMRRDKLSLGGEQSGHIIMADKAVAGDGILAGLSLAELVRASGKPLREMVAEFVEYPQTLTNIGVHDKLAWRDDDWFATRYRRLKARYRGVRFYVRPSGTEDVVRVLTEAEDASRCAEANAEVCRLFAVWDNR